MNATLPILPAAGAAPPADPMPPAGGAAPPAGANKDSVPPDFGAALSAAAKGDGHRAAPHAPPTAAELALLGMQLPVCGNSPPTVPPPAPLPQSTPPPAIQGAATPAAGAGPAPPTATLVPAAAADARSPRADIAPLPGSFASAANIAPATTPTAAAAGHQEIPDSSRRPIATPDIISARAVLQAGVAAASMSTVRSPAAAQTQPATPEGAPTQAVAPPPPAAAVPATQATAAVNPAVASFAAAAAANDSAQQKSPPPIDRAAPADSAPAVTAAAAPVALASIRPSAASAAPPRAAAIAPNAVPAADKLGHGEHGASPSAISPDGAAGAAAALAAPGVAPSARHDGAAAAELPLHAGINTADFPRELADRVTWMVDHSLNGASLQVNPPHLGPIELRISVERGHAAVWMSAQNATTLDALQANAPKLRELLGNHGFGQVSVDISQQSFRDRTPHPQQDAWAAAASGERERAPISMGSVRAARHVHGALDAYA